MIHLTCQVTVIEGSTGSGKSTQVPQFILEHYMETGEHCNIICTQPRRIAAKSVAKFVSDTQGWSLGSLVGYQIGMDRNVTEKTRLTFVTTGVLLEKLVNQRNMNQYTHVILDEVRWGSGCSQSCWKMLVLSSLSLSLSISLSLPPSLPPSRSTRETRTPTSLCWW